MGEPLTAFLSGLQLAGTLLGPCDLQPETRPDALAEYHQLASNCLSLPPWPLDFDADLETAFVLRINEERRSAGLPELQMRPELVAPARFHSLDQTWNDTLSHDGTAGRTATDRVGTLDRTLVWNRLQENVGMVGSGNTAYGLVDRLHQAFMDSDYHRANILSETATHVAVGVVTGFDDWYVTQLFADVAGDLSQPVPVKADRAWLAAQNASVPNWKIVGFNLREDEVSLPVEIAPPGEAVLTLVGNRPAEHSDEFIYVIELHGPLVDAR